MTVKLDAIDKVRIVRLYTETDGLSVQALADRFEVDASTIRIVLRKAKVVIVSSRGKYGGLPRSEVKCLILVAEGMSNEEMAAKLNLSVKTVKKELANVFKRLGVKSRAKAAIKFRERPIARQCWCGEAITLSPSNNGARWIACPVYLKDGDIGHIHAVTYQGGSLQ